MATTIRNDNGLIVGFGTLRGTLSIAGLIQVGGDGSTGGLLVEGDFTQEAGGWLEMYLGGETPGVTYDVLDVTGRATLAGVLQVNLLNDYMPQRGEIFDVLRWDTYSDQFDWISLPELTDDLQWSAEYAVNGFRLLSSITSVALASPRSPHPGLGERGGARATAWERLHAPAKGVHILAAGARALAADVGHQYRVPCPSPLEPERAELPLNLLNGRLGHQGPRTARPTRPTASAPAGPRRE